MRSVLACFVLTAALAGCSSNTACNGALCGACPESFVVHVTGAPSTATATIDGGTCTAVAGALTCSAPLAAGEHDVVVTVNGVPHTVHARIAAAPAGCCTCSPTSEQTLALGAADAGLPTDASLDAATGDAAADDAAATDAGLACDPSAVTFPAGGTLTVGQLCDDVFVCVASAADAAALMAAAPHYTCSTTPAAGCTAYTCRASPSTLDASELAELCAITVLTPRPPITCMIYL
jgi:hypothetical protein